MYSKSPRAVSKPDTIGFTCKSTTSQSRIRQRLSSSPLKFPLQNAISRVMAPKQNNTERYSQSRILVKSRLKDQRETSTSRVLTRNIFKDQPQYLKQKMHLQTNNFLKKYFGSIQQGVQAIAIQNFIQCIMKQYQQLWGSQNSNKVFQDFNYKMFELFGQNVSIRELIKRTLNDGMIGLILQIFKQIKSEQKVRCSNYLTVVHNPKIQNLRRSFQDQLVSGQSLQNVKNVVQEFMQTMYQCMESEIYNKFNVQMRRMVVKYREAQRIMKKVNEKITTHADIFEYQAQMKAKKRQFEQHIQMIKKQKQQLLRQVYRQKSNSELQRRQNIKLQQQIKKLKQNLQKFQNAVLTKVMQQPSYIDTGLSRKISSNSAFGDKQNTPINQQPFKITIDTHVIQKQGEPPETKTIATLYNIGSLANPPPQNGLQGASVAQSRFIQPSQYTPYTPYHGLQSNYSPYSMISRRL